MRDEHGGESIFYFGGGGQGNHLGGAYSGATLRALGARYRSNALAQEKTGEFWVNAKMLGAMVRGDVEHAEVALFIGKNPWQSHGIPHARTTLKEIARDPERALIVIDPRRSETAELADIHLAVRPGTDAWCLAALVAILVQEGLVDRAWLAEHAVGLDEVEAAFGRLDVAAYAAVCGVPEELLRTTARRIAAAASVAAYEDLGIQMNRHSTLASYLEKLVWVLTGNYAKPGAQYAPTAMVALARGDVGGGKGGKGGAASPVAGARIIGGLVPCNVIPEEILTDHPARYRAMLVESGNPAHSLADSSRMREALAALDLVVVIDVAMTETARLAHYVLPAPSQYEKWEATFFNFEFPANVFHLRRPLLSAPDGRPARAGDPRPARRSARSRHRGRPRAAAGGRGRGTGAVRRGLLRGHGRQPDARRPGPDRPLPDPRTDPAGRRRVGGHPLGCGPPLRHVVPRLGAPGRLRG